MADIKLGPAGSQTTLPAIPMPDDAPVEVPYNQESSAEEDQMLDGSIRVNFKDYSPGEWTLTWDGVIEADADSIWAAAPLNQQLVYTNEYLDGADHNVYVKTRSRSLKSETVPTTPRYIVNLVLREIP